MTVTMSAPPLAGKTLTPAARARRHLDFATRGWFAVTVLGQLLFIIFILLFYYKLALSGDYAGWNAKPLITGYVEGDATGNRNFAAHTLVAAVMTLAGLFQLVPAIRTKWPIFHRWSGRIFLSTALFLSLGGLWLTWARGSYATVTGAVAISLDAVLIIAFGIMAWRTARARNFAAHRRWALRTFIAASGVWFMRVGYGAWGIATGGIGITRGLSGPFDMFWAFATHLLPLAILELYLRAERGMPKTQLAMAGGLWLGSAVILLGVAGAWVGMWFPYI